MLKVLKERRAFSMLEYISLILFILGGLYIFQNYILRAILGKTRQAGDIYGHGHQYDPRDFGSRGLGGGTLECYFDYTHCHSVITNPVTRPCALINAWVDTRQFKENCDCTIAPEDIAYRTACLACIESYVTPECQ